MGSINKNEYEDFSFLQMTPDLVIVAGKDGYFKKVNPAVIEKFGFSEEELMSNPISTYIHPDDREATNERRKHLLDGKPLLNFENRYITKSGEIVWLEWTSIYFSDKEIVFAIAKDVTRRKKIETEIEAKYTKFKSLATYFKTSIEQDRKHLANELHEELAQLVTVIKVDIDWIKSNNHNLPDAAQNRIEHALAVAELLVTTIRRISFSISPNMLDDLGLNATLEWLCKEFSVLNGIPCSFNYAYKESDLSHEVKLDFFRISQAALANVMHHAKANTVEISIEEMGDSISLFVRDDGIGISTEELLASNVLNRMHERAISINGKLDIQSSKGNGTCVCLTVPR